MPIVDKYWVFLSACLMVSISTGCATKNPIQEVWYPTNQWLYLAAGDTKGANLKTKDGKIIFFPKNQAQNLVVIHQKLLKVSGVNATLALVQTDSPNAFAFSKYGQNYIAFSLSFMNALGENRDALAAVMGHELAHLKLGHSVKDRKTREQQTQIAGQAAGLLLALVGVPLGGTIGSLTATGIGRSYTRDEERDADSLGIKWSTDAGYNPCGYIDVMNVFEKANQSSQDLTFLSTHPDSGERSKSAGEYSMKINGKPCPK
jgi:predicted Zn-dependent protease